MQIRLFHAILSGVTIAMVLGFSLIPTTWQMISRENGAREGLSPMTNNESLLGLIISIAVIAIILLSFKLIRRIEE